MESRWSLLVLIFLVARIASAQTSGSEQQKLPGVFEKISNGVKNYKIDTTSAPDDKITHKIKELKALRGGFNINEAIEFKLEEDRQKKEMPPEQLAQLSLFFTRGNGGVWLDNATTWIYRKHFSYKELKQLVKFYKTSAGRKMADVFPVLMLQSLAAAEIIKEGYMKHLKK